MFEGVMFTRPWTSDELFAKARRWQVTFLVSFIAMAVIAFIKSPLGLTDDAAIAIFFVFLGLAAVAVVMDDRITTLAKAARLKEERRG